MYNFFIAVQCNKSLKLNNHFCYRELILNWFYLKKFNVLIDSINEILFSVYKAPNLQLFKDLFSNIYFAVVNLILVIFHNIFYSYLCVFRRFVFGSNMYLLQSCRARYFLCEINFIPRSETIGINWSICVYLLSVVFPLSHPLPSLNPWTKYLVIFICTVQIYHVDIYHTFELSHFSLHPSTKLSVIATASTSVYIGLFLHCI